jgi:hypothetical protein
MALNVFVHLELMVQTVFLAQLQELGISLLTHVFVHLQKLSGMELNVFAQLVLMAHHAKPVLLLDSGTVMLVFAQKREYGTDKIVFAPQDSSVQIVFNVQFNNIGMKLLKPVFAQDHSSGTDNTVSAHHHIN